MTESRRQVRLSDWMTDAVDIIGQRMGIDFNNIVRVALDNWIKQQMTDMDKRRLDNRCEWSAKFKLDQEKEWNKYYAEMNPEAKQIFNEAVASMLRLYKNGQYHVSKFFEFYPSLTHKESIRIEQLIEDISSQIREEDAVKRYETILFLHRDNTPKFHRKGVPFFNDHKKRTEWFEQWMKKSIEMLHQNDKLDISKLPDWDILLDTEKELFELWLSNEVNQKYEKIANPDAKEEK